MRRGRASNKCRLNKPRNVTILGTSLLPEQGPRVSTAQVSAVAFSMFLIAPVLNYHGASAAYCVVSDEPVYDVRDLLVQTPSVTHP